MANQPAYEKDNPFTRLIHRVAEQNAASGTDVGRRGMDDPAAPESLPPTAYHTEETKSPPQEAPTMDVGEQQRVELDWYKETGQLTGSLRKTVEANADNPDFTIGPPQEPSSVTPPTQPQPQSQQPLGQFDLTDIRMIDFPSKKLFVGGGWFPLEDDDLWNLSNIAVAIIERSLRSQFERATTQFLPKETADGEDVQRVQGREGDGSVPSTNKIEGRAPEPMQDVQDDVEPGKEGDVQRAVVGDTSSGGEPPKKLPRVRAKRRKPSSKKTD